MKFWCQCWCGPLRKSEGFDHGVDQQVAVKSEASHKSYCDDKFAKANEKTADLETQVATHSSKLEAAISKSSVLDSDEVAELQAVLGALSSQQLKMDAMPMSVSSLPRQRRISNMALQECRRR